MSVDTTSPLQTQLIQLLKLYSDFGITTAVSENESNHFAYIPPKTQHPPLQKNQAISRAAHASSVSITTTAPSIPAAPPSHPTAIMRKAIANTMPENQLAAIQNCTSLEELRTLMSTFEGCNLKQTATNMVFADGNPQAKIMLIGEAPGADEDREGRPFVGLSGQLLDRMLKTVDLSREKNIYISNIIPWRPPGNRQPTPQEISLCRPFIQRHIELINPKILILVGGVATKTILNAADGIMKLRGQWHAYSSSGLPAPIKTMATFHPAYLLRSPGQKAQVWRDLLMVKKEVLDLQSEGTL